MTKQTLAFVFFCCLSSAAFSQVTIDSVYTYKKLNRSLSFAQLTLGGDVLCLSGGQRIASDGAQDFGAGFMPRFTIGGMHFWGHADFYVTFPLGINVQQKPAFAGKFRQLENVETGLKIYPIALRPGRLSPYVGISFQPFQFGYQRAGQDFD